MATTSYSQIYHETTKQGNSTPEHMGGDGGKCGSMGCRGDRSEGLVNCSEREATSSEKGGHFKCPGVGSIISKTDVAGMVKLRERDVLQVTGWEVVSLECNQEIENVNSGNLQFLETYAVSVERSQRKSVRNWNETYV